MKSWKGPADLGTRDYTVEQYRIVVDVLKEHHVGPSTKIHQKHLALDPRIATIGTPEQIGRKLRAILSDADGTEFVLHNGDDGVFVCESYEQAIAGSRRMLAQAASLTERVERRNAYARKRLPRQQAMMRGMEK